MSDESDRILLDKDFIEIIDNCLKIADSTNNSGKNITTKYGIKILGTYKFLLNSDSSESRLIDKIRSDIKCSCDIEEYTKHLEYDEDDIFEIIENIDITLTINGFKIASCDAYGWITGGKMLCILPKHNNVEGLIDLYKFMNKLKKDGRLAPGTTIGPVSWET
jgi:hypothetical protein